ncbi:hypothetical protein MMC25_007821 [Agyrium rufum]|nr:hypothetical protein [Agyrium rufum]
MAFPKTTDHIAHSLLREVHPPDIAKSIFVDKVVRKPLKLRPTSPDPSSQNARETRRSLRLRKTEHVRRRQKPKPLTAREKRKLSVYDIPQESRKYEIYVPLHRMWLEYMWDILGMKVGQKSHLNAQSVGPKLVSADFHGAEVEVVRSKCLGRVGCNGIVLKDTKFTFEVITKDNRLITIPKCHTLFKFQIPQPEPQAEGQEEAILGDSSAQKPPAMMIPPMVFELHGSQFQNRAADRATKKFKPKHLKDL